MYKRKAEAPIVGDKSDLMEITPLGAGSEVGRSCHVLTYKGKTVLLDCGIHPGLSGMSRLPYFDEVDASTIDVLLITHFHVDHSAALPYFTETTTFKGRVFMTHPTKAIFKWLLSDYVKVSNVSSNDALYDDAQLSSCYEKIEAIDYHQEINVDGIKFTAYNAGHVLGAAMFLIEIAGIKILYTGDYSREEDRHLMAAEKPPNVQPDVLICESTYGVLSHEPRLDRERRFTSTVHDIVQRGGRCLLPVFALGQAQELLLMLDEYWAAHPELESIPVYYASSLAKKCMTVYQTYINMMNAKIRKQFAVSNPFVFKHISHLKNMDSFDDTGPCVMMASPGMLQNGLSRELFERWCTDKKNGLIITGYSVENTLAKDVMNEPEEITTMSGQKLKLKMTVDSVSFSAHVDYTQNSAFIDEVKAPHLVLVHGETNAMGRLKSALMSKYHERDETIHIYTPRNAETVKLYFRGEKLAKIIGHMASSFPEESKLVSGVLVVKDFQYTIMDTNDLEEFVGLQTTSVVQRQMVPYHASFSLLKYHLQQMFGKLIELERDETKREAVRVFDTVDVKEYTANQVLLEWTGNSVNDMVADSVLAVILNIEGSPASVKLARSEHKHSHSHAHSHESKMTKEEVVGESSSTSSSSLEVGKNTKDSMVAAGAVESEQRMNVKDDFHDLCLFFESQFGPENMARDDKTRTIKITLDGMEAVVDCLNFTVKCEADALRHRAQNVLERAVRTCML
ncbi:Cleavage and polyadenylation specificity factor subunit 3 [Actinomortierella ambigua]|uniref:Endoribonuclease YSH1 n=1 Tax=Actinomortierella ambigua TaxID=1343610 RepID=A0A9P6Q2J6_9FUNG|nr:Cleavage and polyadenylation specificity factor subunit 3 [Actinomortierella ambigua]